MGKSVSVMAATCGDRARSRAGLSSGLLAPPRHPPPADAAAQSLPQPPRGRLGSGCSPGRRRSAHSQHPQWQPHPRAPSSVRPAAPAHRDAFTGPQAQSWQDWAQTTSKTGTRGLSNPRKSQTGWGPSREEGGRPEPRAWSGGYGESRLGLHGEGRPCT